MLNLVVYKVTTGLYRLNLINLCKTVTAKLIEVILITPLSYVVVMITK
jgi:hypothetical protein